MKFFQTTLILTWFALFFFSACEKELEPPKSPDAPTNLVQVSVDKISHGFGKYVGQMTFDYSDPATGNKSSSTENIMCILYQKELTDSVNFRLQFANNRNYTVIGFPIVGDSIFFQKQTVFDAKSGHKLAIDWGTVSMRDSTLNFGLYISGYLWKPNRHLIKM